MSTVERQTGRVSPPAPEPSGAPTPSAPAPPAGPESIDALWELLPPDQRLFNRDVSWLQFNRRVLAQATDPDTPLLQRVRFLSIFTSNLDEFFMKRIGLIKSRQAAGVETRSPDGLTLRQQLQAIRREVAEQIAEQVRVYEEEILPALEEAGIHIRGYEELSLAQQLAVDDWYRAHVFPALTPLAVDAGRRFPFISNLSNSIGVVLSEPEGHERIFARVKIPPMIPGFVRVPVGPDGSPDPAGLPEYFVPLPEVIESNLDELFPGMKIEEKMRFRVTRSAGVERDEDEVEDLLASVEAEIKMRRFAAAVRMEVEPGTSPAVVDLLMHELDLERDDLYERAGPIDYLALNTIADLDVPQLKQKPWVPVIPARLTDEDRDIFAIIRERDLFLHHPYESFSASVEKFIAHAARDPQVIAIKQTLYRTSRDSPFIASLIRASEEGKMVSCLVEVRARFDEERNVRFARQLEEAGVHVAYGMLGYKTHCKCSLVVRRESDGTRCYAHLGTGNYNPATAQLYTDVSLLTCDPVLTGDAVHLFNCLTGRSLYRDYQRLFVAPANMRDRFNALIDRETEIARAGGKGRIIAKMNSLEDIKLTKRLYEASLAGVQITLFVRGMCCLRAGVPGLSDNIRVVSIIGRFLEHSRVYHFGAGKEDPLDGEWYMGSADWMYRNLNDRFEIITPVDDREARKRLKRMIDIMSEDHTDAWDQQPDGTYTKRTPPPDADPNSPGVLGTFQTLINEIQAQRFPSGL